MAYEKFLSPAKIGTMTIRNRSVLPPMGSGIAKDGLINQDVIDYYARRAKGGCGMIIVEATSVHITSFGPAAPALYDDSFIPDMTKLAGAIKEGGARACVQLWHAGRQLAANAHISQPWAPSAIPCPVVQIMPHVMTTEEIKEIISAYGDAAVRAQKAGFDAVELHGATGYLIDCFLSPHSNQRTDEYGGSLENRARFGCEVLQDARKKVGNDFPVIMRMSADAAVPDGLGLDEAVRAAKLYEAAGADAIDVSRGCYESLISAALPYYMPGDTNHHYAAEIKKVVSVPVILAGRINTPEVAEEILQSGIADFTSLGRTQIADPEFVNKTAAGEVDQIIHCIACNEGCLEKAFTGQSISCVFNPTTCMDPAKAIRPADKKKKVLVIGGGPGGMEAARVSKERGHDVVLLEKGSCLGGQLLTAGRPPQKEALLGAAHSMGHRVYKSGVDVRIFTEATEERIKKEAPDVIIISAGSNPIIPNIKGYDVGNVYEARSVINGESFVGGQNIVIIGGGLIGIETAELLSEQGKKVTIVEMLDGIGKDLGMFGGPYAMQYIAGHQIETHTNSKCVEIKPDSVVLDKEGKTFTIDNVDAVVLAVGASSSCGLEEIAKKYGECYVIGDACKPRKIYDTVLEGNKVAREI